MIEPTRIEEPGELTPTGFGYGFINPLHNPLLVGDPPVNDSNAHDRTSHNWFQDENGY